MDNNYLSNIELYYSEPSNFAGNSATIIGDDFRHITKAMRHKIGDEIYVTNGKGKIIQSEITSITKQEVRTTRRKEYVYENNFKNIFLCIPKLKSPDRFEFVLEKSVELGITNFIVYNSKRTVAKGTKMDRWNKIVISAMKQSLRSFLPVITECNSFEEVIKLKGEIILFEQNSGNNISDLRISPDKNYHFVFGPEGGLDSEEINLVSKQQIYNLAENRLRSETAIIKLASILPSLL